MSKLSTEQTTILKDAKKIKGEQRFFTKFIQEEIIDKGHEGYLKNEEFVKELTTINEKFAISISFLTTEKKTDLRKYFEDDKKQLIISEEELKAIPEDRVKRYEFAKKLEEEGRYDIAKRIYKSIMDLGEDSVAKFMKNVNEIKKKGVKVAKEIKDEDIRVSTYYMSKFSYYMCKVRNQEKLTKKEKQDINKMLKEDKNKIQELLKGGADIEFIMSILGEEIDIETLEREILPNIKEDREPQGETEGEGADREPRVHYTPEELLRIFRDLGEIKKVTLGKEGLDGFVLFTYDNLTIAEKFFKRDEFGDMVEERAATYLVHKNAKLDLEKVTKGKLVEKKNEERHKRKGEKLITSNNHTPGYRENLRANYNALNVIEFDEKTGEIIVKKRKTRKPRKDKTKKTESNKDTEKNKTPKKDDKKQEENNEIENSKDKEENSETKDSNDKEENNQKNGEGDKEEMQINEGEIEEEKKEEIDMLGKIEEVDDEIDKLNENREELRKSMREYLDLIEMVKAERKEEMLNNKLNKKDVKERLEIAKKILKESQIKLQKALSSMREIDTKIRQNEEKRKKLIASYEEQENQGLKGIIDESIAYLESYENGEGRDD